jgi:hypothetical protein
MVHHPHHAAAALEGQGRSQHLMRQGAQQKHQHQTALKQQKTVQAWAGLQWPLLQHQHQHQRQKEQALLP